jgi:hypothetical protein
MVGRTFLYSGTEYSVMKITHVEDDLYDVQTDKRTIRLSDGELRKEFLPVHVPTKKGTNGQALVKYLPDGKDMVDLSAVLNENIKKLQTDATFIDQARAINESAKTIIELKKLQLDVIRTARDLQ